jgi:hypothetical protein
MKIFIFFLIKGPERVAGLANDLSRGERKKCSESHRYYLFIYQQSEGTQSIS